MVSLECELIIVFSKTMAMSNKVAVVGAGVIGLSTALHLSERFAGQLNITVISHQFSPHTTSDKAGAWVSLPDAIPSQSNRHAKIDARFKKWGLATFRKFHSLYRSEENAKVELCLQQGYVLTNSSLPDPWFKDEVSGFRRVEADSVEAKLLGIPPDTKTIWTYGAYMVRPTTYLSWLTEKVKASGASFEQRKISNLEELKSYDVVINCTGLGSHALLGDESLQPVRGQTVAVKAPWVKHWLLDYRTERPIYILPRSRDVLLGGTSEVGNWSETPDPDTTREILESCSRFVPSLSSAEVIDEWAGLRPMRDAVRLESCEGPGDILLVHCYGHGGQGVLLSWGCALEIGDIVQTKMGSART